MSSKLNKLIEALERSAKPKKAKSKPKRKPAKKKAKSKPKRKPAKKKVSKSKTQWRGTAPAKMTLAQRKAWAESMRRARARKA